MGNAVLAQASTASFEDQSVEPVVPEPVVQEPVVQEPSAARHRAPEPNLAGASEVDLPADEPVVGVPDISPADQGDDADSGATSESTDLKRSPGALVGGRGAC